MSPQSQPGQHDKVNNKTVNAQSAHLGCSRTVVVRKLLWFSVTQSHGFMKGLELVGLGMADTSSGPLNSDHNSSLSSEGFESSIKTVTQHEMTGFGRRNEQLSSLKEMCF